MPDKQVSALTAASDLTGSETLHVVQGGDSRKATVGQLSRRRRFTLASAMATSSLTRALVTDGTTPWSFSVVSGRVYRISVDATYQASATTTGGSLGIAASGGATGTLSGHFRGALVNTAAATELSQQAASVTADATGSFLTTTGVGVVNTPHFLILVATFVCTASGTLEMRYASEVAAASQLNAGSTLIVEDIT